MASVLVLIALFASACSGEGPTTAAGTAGTSGTGGTGGADGRNALPNFVAVDFYDIGDLFEVVDALNGL